MRREPHVESTDRAGAKRSNAKKINEVESRGKEEGTRSIIRKLGRKVIDAVILLVH